MPNFLDCGRSTLLLELAVEQLGGGGKFARGQKAGSPFYQPFFFLSPLFPFSFPSLINYTTSSWSCRLVTLVFQANVA